MFTNTCTVIYGNVQVILEYLIEILYQIPIQPKNTVLWHLVLYKIIPKLREK